VDIDNFKPFNDLYGYAKGDEVLLCLAQCLNERIDRRLDFVGHIGGDDFMLVLGGDDWEHRIEQLQRDFQCRSGAYYKREHVAEGFFTATSRDGQEQRYALPTLSIGVVKVRPECTDHLDAGRLAALASEAKRHAKKISGPSYHLIDTAVLAGSHSPSCAALVL